MGHLRLGHLAHTQKWKHVIGLLEEGAPLPDLADASLDASLTGLKRIPNDPGYLQVLNTIVELAAVSRKKDLNLSLYNTGISDTDQTSSFGFLSAISRKVSDNLGEVYPRSDVGKIAQDAFLSALTKQIKEKSGSLFGENETAKSLTEPFRGKHFKSLMHEFYSGLTSRYLSYYLSRELPHHVGQGRRFANLAEHTEFSRQLETFCQQTVRIADEFTPGWVGKAIYEKNIGSDAISRYAHVAIKKIISEFRRSGQG